MSKSPTPPSAPPEWQRSGRFLLIAVILHAALVLLPLPGALDKAKPPEPLSVLVKPAATAITPPQPIITPAVPRSAAPPTPAPRQAKPQPTPQPLLALAPQAVTTPPPFTVPAPVAAAPVPQPTAPAPTAPTLTTARFDAAYLQNPKPAYPAISRRLGEEGKVLLKVKVTADGQAAAVDLEKSSNFERLDEAARQAVSRWRFVPAKRGDEAIEAYVIVPIVFRLDN